MAEHVQIRDRVDTRNHPRNQARYLDRGVRPGRPGHRHVLRDKLVQAGFFTPGLSPRQGYAYRLAGAVG